MRTAYGREQMTRRRRRLGPLDPEAVHRKRHLWGGEEAVPTPGDARVTLETPPGSTELLTYYGLNSVDESTALAAEAVETLLVAGAWPATHADNRQLLLRARAFDGVRWAVDADRPVVGGRRRSPAGKATFGSTSHRVLMNADRPVTFGPGRCRRRGVSAGGPVS